MDFKEVSLFDSMLICVRNMWSKITQKVRDDPEWFYEQTSFMRWLLTSATGWSIHRADLSTLWVQLNMPWDARAKFIVLALLLFQRRTVRVLLTVLACSLLGLIRATSLLLWTNLFDQHLVSQKSSAALRPLITSSILREHDQILSYLPWYVFLEYIVQGCEVLFMRRDNLLLLGISRGVCCLRYLLGPLLNKQFAK